MLSSYFLACCVTPAAHAASFNRVGFGRVSSVTAAHWKRLENDPPSPTLTNAAACKHHKYAVSYFFNVLSEMLWYNFEVISPTSNEHLEVRTWQTALGWLWKSIQIPQKWWTLWSNIWGLVIRNGTGIFSCFLNLTLEHQNNEILDNRVEICKGAWSPVHPELPRLKNTKDFQ